MFIDWQQKCWKEEWVKATIGEIGWEIVQQVSIPAQEEEDVVFWLMEPDDKYRAKSGYRKLLEMNMRREEPQHITNNTHLQPVLNLLWKLKIPQKKKIFCWRLLKNALPAKKNLSKRGITADSRCYLCRIDNEDVNRLFWSCPEVKCALKSIFRWQLLSGIDDDLPGIVHHVMKNYDNKSVCRLLVTWWLIWSSRNQYREVGEGLKLLDIPNRCENVLYQLEAVNFDMGGSLSAGSIAVHWKPPMVGQVKINVDAGFKRQDGLVGVGLVIRDHEGCFIAACCWSWKDCADPPWLESKGMLLSIKWVMQLTLQDITLETDSLLLANCLSTQLEIKSSVGRLVEEIKECKTNRKL